MKVTPQFIVICERAFTAANSNNLNLINIFTTIHAAKFPFTHPQFAVVVNFDIDTPGAHTLQVDLLGPDQKRLTHSELPVTTNAGNWQVIANFELMQFAASGSYTFQLALDGVSLGSRTLQVLSIASPSSTANVA